MVLSVEIYFSCVNDVSGSIGRKAIEHEKENGNSYGLAKVWRAFQTGNARIAQW